MRISVIYLCNIFFMTYGTNDGENGARKTDVIDSIQDYSEVDMNAPDDSHVVQLGTR